MVKNCVISICVKKIFLSKLFSPLIKASVSPQFRQFWENCFFDRISTGVDLTKMLKICFISICAKKIIFLKIICSTHQKKCFSTILDNFCKIEFFKEYRQAQTLQNGEKFVLSQFVLRKYFLSKLFSPLIKGSVSLQF